MKIVTLTLNPALDKSSSIDRLIPEQKLRCAPMRLDAGGGGINVSKGIRKLGGESTAVFPSGGATGLRLQALLQEAGVSANAGNGMVLSVAMTSGDKHYVTALLDKGADAKAFPLIAETIADIRKQRDGTGTDAEKFKNPVYDEIIALVEAAIARQTTVAENPAPGPLAISEAPQRIGGPTGPAP